MWHMHSNGCKSPVWAKALGFLPFLLVTFFYLLATNKGNSLTFDSYCYKEVAQNLAESFRYSRQGTFIVYWPPLYSFILSLAHPYMETFILFFHWLCLTATLFIWKELAKFYLGKRWAIYFALLLALSTPLLMLAVFVWTEMFFVLLLSLYLFYTTKFIQDRKYSLLWYATFFAFLMMLQRNAGFFLFIGSSIGLLWSMRSFSRRKILYVLLHGLLSVSGFAVWNIYAIIIRDNLHVPGELLPVVSFGRNFLLTFTELGLNFVPAVIPSFFTAVAGLLILSSIGGWIFRKRAELPSLVFIFITVVFYLFVWVVIPADKYNISRFLAVILPAFYLLFFVVMRYQFERYPKIQIPLGVCLLLWGVYSLLRVINNVVLWGDLA